jgi:PDZ domain
MKVGSGGFAAAMALAEEIPMSCHARTRRCGLCSIVILAVFAIFAAESQGQQAQWSLGVKTETVGERMRTAGANVNESGAVNRPQPTPPQAVVPQDDALYGLRITEVAKGSAAEKAGLRVGDLVGKVNNQTVDSPEALVRLVRASGGVITVVVADGRSATGYKTKTIDLLGPEPRPGEVYVPHIGIYYEKVLYQGGTFGARLTRNPVVGSPARQFRIGAAPQLYYLEKGDTILELDGQTFRTEADVSNHQSETTMRFIDKNTRQVYDGIITLP